MINSDAEEKEEGAMNHAFDGVDGIWMDVLSKLAHMGPEYQRSFSVLLIESPAIARSLHDLRPSDFPIEH